MFVCTVQYKYIQKYTVARLIQRLQIGKNSHDIYFIKGFVVNILYSVKGVSYQGPL